MEDKDECMKKLIEDGKKGFEATIDKIIKNAKIQEKERIIKLLESKRITIPPEGEEKQGIINQALFKIITELNDAITEDSE